jgi:hypothetical protein
MPSTGNCSALITSSVILQAIADILCRSSKGRLLHEAAHSTSIAPRRRRTDHLPMQFPTIAKLAIERDDADVIALFRKA